MDMYLQFIISGWTRLLYSTKIKLFPWIPEFIINFLTSKALLESTSWVKKESELEQAKNAKTQKSTSAANAWFNLKGGAGMLALI